MLNRLHVAQPVPRDEKVRAPCIPENVLKKRQKIEERSKAKRKLEREIEEELGDDYILDLKKNYDIEGDQKYDIIPEIWEGHNISDYIDPEIFDVCILLIESKYVYDNLIITLYLYMYIFIYLSIEIKRIGERGTTS